MSKVFHFKHLLAVFGLSALLSLVVPSVCPAETVYFSVLDHFSDLEDSHFFNTQTSDRLPKNYLFAGTSTQFISRPFDILNTTGTRVKSGIEHAFFSIFALQYAPSDKTRFGVKIPYVYREKFSDPSSATATSENIMTQGDLIFSFRYTPFSTAENHKAGFSLFTFITAPTGRETKYIADENPVGGLVFIGDYQVYSGLKAALNVGMDFRERVLLGNIDYSHRLLLNFGLIQKIFSWLHATVETKARTSMNNFFTEQESSPVEFYAGLTAPLTDSGLRISVGGGSCAVCGIMGSRARAMVNLSYDIPLHTKP